MTYCATMEGIVIHTAALPRCFVALPKKTVSAAALSLVLGFLGISALLSSAAQGVPLGDLVISGNQTFLIRDTTYIQTGQVLVRDNATLLIRYAMLQLSLKGEGCYHIDVTGNAKIVLESGTINALGRGSIISLGDSGRLILQPESSIAGIHSIVSLQNSSVILERSRIKVLSAVFSGFEFAAVHATIEARASVSARKVTITNSRITFATICPNKEVSITDSRIDDLTSDVGRVILYNVTMRKAKVVHENGTVLRYWWLTANVIHRSRITPDAVVTVLFYANNSVAVEAKTGMNGVAKVPALAEIISMNGISFVGNYKVMASVEGSISPHQPVVLNTNRFVSVVIGKTSSSLTCAVSSKKILQSEAINANGVLTPTLVDTVITLTYVKPNGDTVKRRVRTDARASYADTFVPDQAGEWRVTASWIGEPDYEDAFSNVEAFVVESLLSRLLPLIGALGVPIGVGASGFFYIFYWRRRHV